MVYSYLEKNLLISFLSHIYIHIYMLSFFRVFSRKDDGILARLFLPVVGFSVLGGSGCVMNSVCGFRKEKMRTRRDEMRTLLRRKTGRVVRAYPKLCSFDTCWKWIGRVSEQVSKQTSTSHQATHTNRSEKERKTRRSNCHAKSVNRLGCVLWASELDAMSLDVHLDHAMATLRY